MKTRPQTPRPAWLALETGAVYEGRAFGAAGESLGELVFNTGTTGYVETLTDPSYHGQIVVMTQPHIGNHGVQPGDFERERVAAAGFVVSELTERGRHPGSRFDLDGFLKQQGVAGIAGVPTRALTLMLRSKGALRGLISTRKAAAKSWLAKIRRFPLMKGRALVDAVSVKAPYVFEGEEWEGGRRIAVLDLGVKRSLLESLKQAGCAVKVFPAATGPEELTAQDPDGVVLSNGPGDPAPLGAIIRTAQALLQRGKPLLGICLGHQVLGLAAGANAYKLPFGHHGLNHPVRDERTGKILITSQNHGFSLTPASLPKDYAKTHLSLNDGTLEGFRHKRRPVFAYQFHPEAGPGPTESRELLREFIETV